MPTPRPHTADCIFCAIIRGDAPATFVHEDEMIVAFMVPPLNAPKTSGS
jgi:diadenosine tetraphosphate (Ap4A) HIT family hydrolase